ncbi:MAG: hypothetical protein LBP61_07025 [Desulfovibrio sp.]|jgi:hypothetical protein|nr:hypothetical protein [Desulfovibrio sp.]
MPRQDADKFHARVSGNSYQTGSQRHSGTPAGLLISAICTKIKDSCQEITGPVGSGFVRAVRAARTLNGGKQSQKNEQGYIRENFSRKNLLFLLGLGNWLFYVIVASFWALPKLNYPS